MGTPMAVTFAAIRFYWHEKHALIPNYNRKIPLMLCFVDDIVAIALVGEEDGLSTHELDTFKQDIDNVGTLRWKVQDPKLSICFLDLTLTI